MTSLTISQLAHRSGVPATTLRYYEKVGVIPPAARSVGRSRIASAPWCMSNERPLADDSRS